jgi:hypothetical protein
MVLPLWHRGAIHETGLRPVRLAPLGGGTDDFRPGLLFDSLRWALLLIHPDGKFEVAPCIAGAKSGLRAGRRPEPHGQPVVG